MDSKAMRPNFVSQLAPEPAKIQNGQATDDEKFLYGMTQTAGWQVFTKLKDELVQDMDRMQETAIAQGVTKEEIGENAIIISMAKGVIHRLWKYIDDSQEACERPTGGT